MSKFLFDGRNHGGTITEVDIQFKLPKYEGLGKVINWMLARRIKQGDIKSVVITTLQKRAQKDNP